MKVQNDDDFVAYEGADQDNDQPQSKEKGCFHDRDDHTWMNIDPKDEKVIRGLIELEHPLKQVSPKLIYSDLVYRFTCKHKKMSVQSYRREIEEKLMAEGKLDRQRSHVLMRTPNQISEDRDSIHDPFYRFGLGIYTYIKLQRALITFLLFLSVLSVIQMLTFYGDLSKIDEDFMDEEANKLSPIEKITSKLSLGSYFQAYPLCHDAPIEMDNIEIKCRGDMKIQEIQDVNVFRHGKNLCSSNKEEFKKRMSKDDFANFTKDIDDLSKCNKESFFKKKDFTKILKEKCLGKHSCSFNGQIKNQFDDTDDCWNDKTKLDLVVQVKCGNSADVIKHRNMTGVLCSSLGLLGNLLFIIGISHHLSRRNKIRALKYANYTVSSKNFSCEIVFDDDHFDALCYDKDEDKWYQNEDEFRDEDGELTTSELHWTYQHHRPGHALQNEVQRILQYELTNFYGLNEPNYEAWKNSDGYQLFLQAIKKFPQEEKDLIEKEVAKIQYEIDENENYFKIVFCTFAFKNKDMLIQLTSRANKLSELKTCNLTNKQELETKLQNVLDANYQMVTNILGGTSHIVAKEDDQEDGEGTGNDNQVNKSNDNEEDDQEINDELKEAMLNEKRITLMTPQSAFVTFRNPFAAFLSKKMMKIIQKNKIKDEDKPKLFDRNINFGKMGYPSDTQYLNFGVSSTERIINIFMVGIIIYFWAYAFFSGMFTLYQMMQNRNLLFLTPEKCNTIWNEYQGRIIQYQDNAIEEYTRVIEDEKGYGFSFWLIADNVPLMQSLRGEFTCFCDFLEKKQTVDFLDVARMFDSTRKVHEKCGEYLNLKQQIGYIKLMVTLFLSVCNAISKKLIMWIIQLLNFKKKSSEAISNYLYMLSVTAFTSIFVILILGAKLDFVPIVGKYLKAGKNRDFTWEWYMEIGCLFIFRMLILAINPLIEVTMANPVRKIKQYLFLRKGCGNSKQKTMWQYYNSELGAPWFFEVNLFKLGNVLLMAFMFGPGIPIMFPLALVYTLINESALRYQLAYQCRSPFNYSMQINRTFIRFCAFLPILYASFGIWMYSNRQIYDNAVLPKAYSNGLQDHSHTIVYTLTTVTPAMPLIFLLIIAVPNFFIILFNYKYHRIFKFVPGTLASKIAALRIADMDNFYEYIKEDPQYELFENLNKYLSKVLGTLGVSKEMYKEFQDEVKKQEKKPEEEQQLFASRLLYEMIVDHNYASLFDFRYSLIQNPLTDEQLDKKGDIQGYQKKKTTVDGQEDSDGLDEFDMKKFMCAEDTKTLFMIHYAFIDKRLRFDTKWLTQETFLEFGKLVGKKPIDGDSAASYGPGGRKPILDLQDFAIL